MKKGNPLFPAIIFVYYLITGCISSQDKTGKISMFRGDAFHSGVFDSLPVTMEPGLKWTFKTNGPVISSPILFDGKLYIGSNDGNLYCLEASSGLELWRFRTGGAVCSTPAVLDKRVFFGSYDGKFYSLNADTGDLIWQFVTAGEKKFSAPGIHGNKPKDSVFVDDWDLFLSSPAVAGNKVYFGTGSGYCYALDVNKGNLLWKFKTNGVVHSSPAIGFGNVYIGSWDTYMYALDKNTGQEKWKFKTGIDTIIYNQTGIQGSPLIKDSLLYFGCRDSYLYALGAVSGKKIWQRYNNTDWVITTPLIYRDKIIYGTSANKKLIALDKHTGALCYEVQNKGFIFSSPALAGACMYYGEFNGLFTCADGNTGKKLWSYQITGAQRDNYRILARDSSINETLVFDSSKIAKEKMSAIRMIFSLGAVLSSPVIQNKTAYFGSADGNVYALALKYR